MEKNVIYESPELENFRDQFRNYLMGIFLPIHVELPIFDIMSVDSWKPNSVIIILWSVLSRELLLPARKPVASYHYLRLVAVYIVLGRVIYYKLLDESFVGSSQTHLISHRAKRSGI